MCVDPEDTSDAACPGEAAERAERDRVVAAEDERQRVLIEREADEPCDPAAGRLDLGEVARALVGVLGRLEHGRLDVAPVEHVVAELAQPVVETGVADRGRPHVDAAASRPEIERGADDRDLLACCHGENLLLQSDAEAR